MNRTWLLPSPYSQSFSISPQESAVGSLKATSALVEQTEAGDKNTRSGPDNVQAVPAILDQMPIVVENLRESPSKKPCDKHLSAGCGSLEKVPTAPEQTPSGVDGSGEFHGDKVGDEKGEVGISPVVAVGVVEPGGNKEERELLTTPVEGTDLGSKNISSKDNDHIEGSEGKANAPVEPSRIAANNGVQADGDCTESSSNRDYNEESPLITGKQQCPADSWVPAPSEERMSRMEEPQSNCVDKDLIKES